MNISAPVADISFHAAIEAEYGGHELRIKIHFDAAKNQGYVELKQEGEGDLTIYMLRSQMADLYKKLSMVFSSSEEALLEKEPTQE